VGSSLSTRAALVRSRLHAIGQAHVLAFWDELGSFQRERLVSDLESVDLEQVPDLVARHIGLPAAATLPDAAQLEPVDAAPMPGADEREAGEELLAQGEVAALTVAGGQGTRLGFDGPKGAYPIGPVSSQSFFHLFASSLRGAQARYGKVVPWLIMTSLENHDATAGYFEANDFFGLDAASVCFFRQGRMPCLTPHGMMVLAQPDRLAMSPDGHGGLLDALARSGALSATRERGVVHLSYFQVDNPMVRLLDPSFLGAHALSQAELSSKAMAKAYPNEALGNFVCVDGRTRIVEYSEMPEALARQTRADGSLRYRTGSISIYAIQVAFLQRLIDEGLQLPLHKAVKRQKMIDPVSCKTVEGEVVKLERFVFDILPEATRVLIVLADRQEEFGPVKNLTGADSVESCKRAMVRRAARWLEQRGVSVPRDDRGEVLATIEISPRVATEASELAEVPAVIQPGSVVYVGEAPVVRPARR
jgi:UDP-N-acetylglucosamine/UDP-N-acetylgalactosamine diphosphorylase